MPKINPGWRMVAAVALALMMSGTTFATGAFGVFTHLMTRSFGWTQAQMAPALSLFLVSTVVCLPIVGLMVDRLGARRVAMCGILGLTIVMASGALIHSMFAFYLFFAAVGVTGAFTNPIVYLKAISRWFDGNRGLAIGVAVAGQGVGLGLLPVVIDRISERAGWPASLIVLAGILIVVILPMVALFVSEGPVMNANWAADPPELTGLTLRQALRGRSFWIIVAVLALFGLSSYAVSANLVFLLTHNRTLTLRDAAEMQALAGLSMVVGRVVFGWFMDRFPAPLVGVGGVLCLAIAVMIVPHLARFGPLALTCAVMIGLSAGAETNLLSLLVGRYFGTLALSRIYSWHNVAFLAGAAAGPPLFALAVTGLGGPGLALGAVAAASIAAAGLLLLLGPYPRFERLIEPADAIAA